MGIKRDLELLIAEGAYEVFLEINVTKQSEYYILGSGKVAVWKRGLCYYFCLLKVRL
jgi:hypothetical protein